MVAYCLKRLYFILFACVLSIGSYAQETRIITGEVSDGNEFVPGVNVFIKGTTIGALTDVNGKYTIEAPLASATLVFSFMGYETQEIEIQGRSIINVIMELDLIGLNEIVVVGYGTKKKSDLSGAISTVAGATLAQTKTASVTNSIAGRIPGVISRQSTGEPGKDGSSINIRGFGAALIIVDGVEQNINSLASEEIESITVLKDAAAAIYGARAGNGVVLITTKRGNNAKPTINFNINYSLQTFTFLPNAVNSGQYAELMNELQTNDGAAPVYTEDDIQKYYDGSDPLNYPNTDWWALSMRDYSPQITSDISLRGGNNRVKYYTFLGYLDQEGMYKSGDNTFKRYNIRANIDAEVTDYLSASINTSSIHSDIKRPIRSIQNLWQDFYNSMPIMPGEFPDPTKIATGGNGTTSVVAGTSFDKGGYSGNKLVRSNISGSLNLKLPWVEGLTFKGFGSFVQNKADTKDWSKQYNVYSYDPATDVYSDMGSSYTTNLRQTSTTTTIFTTQLSASFRRTIADNHNVDALALYERIDRRSYNLGGYGENFLTNTIDYLFASGDEGQTTTGTANEDGRKSYVGRLNYNYKSKYYAQATIRYDGSPRFNKGNQWGVFPSFSAAWRLSEESFIKNNADWVDNLKLRGSMSNLGYDDTGNFQYLSGYKITTNNVAFNTPPGYVTDGIPMTTIHSTGLSNPGITWENMSIYNAGIDLGLLQSKLYLEADVFYRLREDMLATRYGTLPNTFGAVLPKENINSQSNRGFEFQMGHKNTISDFVYSVSGNVSWTRARWEHFEEAEYTDTDDIRIKQKTGNWVNRTFAYQSDGLFTSQEEIDNHPLNQDGTGNATIKPGDVRYLDYSGPDGVPDSVLDWRDQVEIGKSSVPELMFGITFSAKYKGFDFDMLWQGAGNSIVRIGSVLPNSTRTPYEFVYDNRWTEDNNNANAQLPRLSSNSYTHNTYHSDFWYVNGAYFRLKNLNFGYTFPKQWMNAIGIERLRIYFAGTNLITFSELKKWDRDPEGPNNQAYYYPQQKTYSFGLSLSL